MPKTTLPAFFRLSALKVKQRDVLFTPTGESKVTEYEENHEKNCPRIVTEKAFGFN